ncbi:hypothetical protein TH47_15860 [Thalassospira sp. MCCC 1A02803]|nr:hypothetical protein TH47_15860 [Thalassospira sp. MCCC 1A02803]
MDANTSMRTKIKDARTATANHSGRPSKYLEPVIALGWSHSNSAT